MKKVNKNIISSILIILVFFSLFIPKSNANFFTDDNSETDIKKTIENDDGGIFEKIIAKMIRWISRSYL